MICRSFLIESLFIRLYVYESNVGMCEKYTFLFTNKFDLENDNDIYLMAL